MPDYNIYIHAINNGTSQASPTTPWQLKEGSGSADGGTISGGGGSPASMISKGAAFITNPDSLIGGIVSSTWGKMGIAGVVIAAAISITDKAVTMYQGYASSASGDYKAAIDYNNFKAVVHNVFRPFSTEVQRQQMVLQIKKDNLANEQQRLLLGGSFINSPYGRYL